MFCPHCGAQCEDGARFCVTCGKSIDNAAPAAPAAPAQPLANGINVMSFIPLGLAILALIVAIMNIFNTYDVSATISGYGRSTSTSGSVADLVKSGEYPMIMIGNLLFGLVSLAVAAIGIMVFLKENKFVPALDGVVEKLPMPPLFLMGAAGAGAAVVQFVFYLLSSKNTFGVSTTISVHWITWVMLVVCAGAAVVDKMGLIKKD